jgi:hypothetical protein
VPVEELLASDAAVYFYKFAYIFFSFTDRQRALALTSCALGVSRRSYVYVYLSLPSYLCLRSDFYLPAMVRCRQNSCQWLCIAGMPGAPIMPGIPETDRRVGGREGGRERRGGRGGREGGRYRREGGEGGGEGGRGGGGTYQRGAVNLKERGLVKREV